MTSRIEQGRSGLTPGSGQCGDRIGRGFLLAALLCAGLVSGCKTTDALIDDTKTGTIAPPARTAGNFGETIGDSPILGTATVAFANPQWQAKWDYATLPTDMLEVDRCPVGLRCGEGALRMLRDTVAKSVGKGPLERVRMANRAVNAALSYVPDNREDPWGDRWQSLSESLERGAADCEDFAVAKYQMLKAMGFRQDAMSLVILKKPGTPEYHAILAVRLDDRTLILDNRAGEVADDRVAGGYRPVFSFVGHKMKIHGTRVSA
ncbi:MAG: transglutaminase-like cysteine peptidase [Oricola sp.]